jgi:hypothetical protein
MLELGHFACREAQKVGVKDEEASVLGGHEYGHVSILKAAASLSAVEWVVGQVGQNLGVAGKGTEASEVGTASGDKPDAVGSMRSGLVVLPLDLQAS